MFKFSFSEIIEHATAYMHLRDGGDDFAEFFLGKERVEPYEEFKAKPTVKEMEEKIKLLLKENCNSGKACV